MRAIVICLLASALMPSRSQAQVPVFEVTTEGSSISFNVEASVAIKGTFQKWESKFTCPSVDATQCVLEIKVQADSIDTGSGMKNGKLKGKDFFNVNENPYITFKSTRIVQTGPTTFEVAGDFSIRGATKSQKLILNLEGKGTGSGKITGTMAFDRKDYGMTSGIPFVKIADRVEVTVDLQAKRLSGPPLVFSQ